METEMLLETDRKISSLLESFDLIQRQYGLDDKPFTKEMYNLQEKYRLLIKEIPCGTKGC